MLTILTTPKSISITDSDKNRIVILKGENGIELHSSIETSKKTNIMLELQRKISKVITTPKNNRDNYKVRFDRLKKIIEGVNIKTFTTIRNGIAELSEI